MFFLNLPCLAVVNLNMEALPKFKALTFYSAVKWSLIVLFSCYGSYLFSEIYCHRSLH